MSLIVGLARLLPAVGLDNRQLALNISHWLTGALR